VAEGTHLLAGPRRIRCATGTTRASPNLLARSTRPPSRCGTDVAADDELTIDYAPTPGVPDWSMACSCGSAGCRGVVTGQDWRRAELRAAYGCPLDARPC